MHALLTIPYELLDNKINSEEHRVISLPLTSAHHVVYFLISTTSPRRGYTRWPLFYLPLTPRLYPLAFVLLLNMRWLTLLVFFLSF